MTATTTAPAVVTRWTGGNADALRLALRLTQEAFAGRLDMAARTVAAWRACPDRIVSANTAQLLDIVWSRTDADTRARFANLTDTTPTVPTDLHAELAALTAQVTRLAALMAHLTPA